MSKKPEPYSEEEKRLAKIHRCHPQNIRDFNAFIQHTRKVQASTLLVVPKISKPENKLSITEISFLVGLLDKRLREEPNCKPAKEIKRKLLETYPLLKRWLEKPQREERQKSKKEV